VGHRTTSYSLYGGSVFTECSNVYLTPQLGQERWLRVVRAAGLSRLSYPEVSELLLPVYGEGHRYYFMGWYLNSAQIAS
jgi:hypothetical protein